MERDESRPTRRELARALGIVDDYVRRLAKAGMPTTSTDAARAWRAEHMPHATAHCWRVDVSAPIPKR